MSNLIHDSNSTISELTKKLATELTDRGLRLTTAESCTGGNLAVALCAEENTAEFYDVGMVVFSDAAKERILGVRHETIERFTAVSEQTVTEMAAKIREIAEADIGLAISGYAGPEGGDDGTAAGTVCFGWNIRGQTETRTVLFSGECQDVVDKAVRYSLSELIEILSGWDNV
ncbi:TPA: 2-oxo-tetronate isomerase [Enterobacter hormaechei]|uniref:2-oxo-tetronate isomerase n=1 Tax=Enterobacter TaxID=547 RepID=UPI000F82B1CB|nr:2-oxo-tetronate isomerase [Enterobacter hormaechei]MCE1570939.1 2-oxo-tetronate isomerase [Enterobacter hormaechei]MCM7253631.1 2-oxo-tetronate isomerase [Enterobacter hormaechei]MCM7314667.1 2-oxo-tetronate isomerase [Enterobacter hormaechei]MCM8178759.1 2-oxo-tetronate isomerase [Enterobacter hormaechei]MEB8027465.1 2-oxo-tetronate isomerase [Enterobacter hormaechei]